MKKFFDILLTIIGLMLLSPILLFTAIVLKFTGEGYIFYFQERIGRNGETFRLIKFATMLYDSPKIGAGDITLSDDPRVLPVGKFLRRTKINELPQLFNVLIGDMSLVGPRPLTRKNFNLYSCDIRNVVQQVRPGLTGVGSIVFRDEEKLTHDEVDPVRFYAEHIAPYKGALEKWYCENNSLSMYFKIILLTVKAVISSNAQLTMLGNNLPQPSQQLLSKFNQNDPK